MKCKTLHPSCFFPVLFILNLLKDSFVISQRETFLFKNLFLLTDLKAIRASKISVTLKIVFNCRRFQRNAIKTWMSSQSVFRCMVTQTLNSILNLNFLSTIKDRPVYGTRDPYLWSGSWFEFGQLSCSGFNGCGGSQQLVFSNHVWIFRIHPVSTWERKRNGI